jgi:hypothetical protein
MTSGSPITPQNLDSPYPPPDSPKNLTENGTNPYPSPHDVGTPKPALDCSRVGQWIEYKNQTVGFSFKYPAESLLREDTQSNDQAEVSFLVKQECYANDCWGVKGITIRILDNPNNFGVQEFVSKRFNPNASTAYAIPEEELKKNIQLIQIDGVQASLVRGPLTFDHPQVYIPIDDFMIFIGLSEMSKGIWIGESEPPCEATLELFEMMLASVKLSQTQ